MLSHSLDSTGKEAIDNTGHQADWGAFGSPIGTGWNNINMLNVLLNAMLKGFTISGDLLAAHRRLSL